MVRSCETAWEPENHIFGEWVDLLIFENYVCFLLFAVSRYVRYVSLKMVRLECVYCSFFLGALCTAVVLCIHEGFGIRTPVCVNE